MRPRELGFKVWTDPKHVQQWWGRTASPTRACDWDARPGRPITVDMKAGRNRLPDDRRVPRDHRARRNSSSQRRADEQGGSPLEVLNTVTFNERGGKTTIFV
jgi:uncharacterized protein YndB with AHSA1/START domain